MPQMKSLSKTVFALYLLTLLWLVLFKFSFNISTILSSYQSRSLNLIPFASSSLRDILYNFVVFIPFGLLLSVNLRRTTIWRKLALIFALSLAVEITQFILAIGSTDVTDVITNTFGGFIGLTLYDLGNKHIDNEKLDKFIVATTMVLLILFLLLRTLVFHVRYHSTH